MREREKKFAYLFDDDALKGFFVTKGLYRECERDKPSSRPQAALESDSFASQSASLPKSM